MAPKTNAKRIDPVLTVIASPKEVPMPARVSTRGSKTNYPFDQLTAIGMSFGVTNKTAKQLASIVSNQNRKLGKIVNNPDGTPKVKEVIHRDPQGNEIGRSPEMKDGKPVYETEPSKKFYAVDTDPKKDPHKATARVFREL